jgi:hypothetical protein
VDDVFVLQFARPQQCLTLQLHAVDFQAHLPSFGVFDHFGYEVAHILTCVIVSRGEWYEDCLVQIHKLNVLHAAYVHLLFIDIHKTAKRFLASLVTALLWISPRNLQSN